jgi:hypothetical protein
MDWLGWKTTLGLLRDYPELIAATAQFAVGLGALVWGVRSLIGRERVATLKDLNANLEKRLSEAIADLRNAQSTQERIAAELDMVKRTSDQQSTELQQLKAAVEKLQAPQVPQPTVQLYVNVNKHIATITSSTATLAGQIQEAAQANTTLGTSLIEIAAKLEGKGDLRANSTVIKSS